MADDPTSYATAAEFMAYAFQSEAGDTSLYEDLCLRASRIFDRAAEVEAGYFLPTDDESSDKTLYGDGTDRLILPPHEAGSVTAVELPEGYSEVGSEFIEHGAYLIRTVGGAMLPVGSGYQLESAFYGHASAIPNPALVRNVSLAGYFGLGSLNGFPHGVAVTVTAKWGGRFDAVPADVKHAVLELANKMWRTKDSGFLPVIDMGTSRVLNKALPEITQLVADSYRRAEPGVAFS